MTDLSPKAQAIWDTYIGGYSTLLMTPLEQFDTYMDDDIKKTLAAVLRVLIDEIVPEDYDHWDGRDGEFWNGFEFGQNQRNEDIRLQVLKIVKELENE